MGRAPDRDSPASAHGRGSSPVPRSHYLPRTRGGALAAATFLVLLALAEPPIVFLVANRIEPWILGVPFLYAWLLAVYVGMIAVLVVARWRGL